MTEWGVVQVLIGVLGLIGTFYSLFYKPLHAVVIELKVLNANLENSKKDDMKRDSRLDKHGERLDNHDSRITKLETIKFVKERIN